MRSAILFSLSILAAYSLSAQTVPILVAQSRYIPVGGTTALYDSVWHVHLNGRNSTILTDGAIRTYRANGIYNADTSYLKIQYNSYKEVRQFNTAGLLTQYWRYETNFSSPSLANEEIYVYNSMMLPDTITKWTTPNSAGTRDVYDYDINGNLLHSINYTFNPNPYDFWPSWQWAYTYDNGKVIEIDADQFDWNTTAWKPGYRDSFLVSGVGSDSVYVRYLWNGASYNETWRHQYKRNGSNHVLSDSVYQGGNFDHVTCYTYDAQGRLIADSSAYWNVSWQTMLPAIHREYRYNAQWGITAIKNYYTIPSGNPLIFAEIDSFTYNNFNQVTSRRSYDSTSTQLYASLSPDIQYFYYKPFTGDVPEATTNQSTLHLYPIPATSYININMSFTKPQPFSVRIFDMQGRLVSNWQEAAQKEYNKQIPIINMSPGQYTLHILAGSESVSRQFTVLR